jgi:hypothetical protein
MLVERSTFDKCYHTPIYVQNNSSGNVFNCKISNTTFSGIYIENKSKLNIQDVTFENCQNLLYLEKNSEIDASNCHFLKMREYSVYCQYSSIASLNACQIVDPGITFFYIGSDGFVKNNSSDLKQSDSSKQFSTIKTNGKLSIIMGSIEWKGVLDYSTEFKDASLVQLQNVHRNQILLNYFKE